MGRKDTAGREFFSDKRRFAELLNIQFYHGEQVVLAENLMRIRRDYPALAGVYGEKERDLLIADSRHGIHYGMELETESDYSMPERIMVYDACEYERQIRKLYKRHRETEDFTEYREKKSRMKATDLLYPAVTIVLYLGEGHWKGKLRLSEMFRISEQDRKLLDGRLPEYDFLLVEADYVNTEDYQTDLKQFFQAMQCRQDKKKLRELLRSESFVHLDPEAELAIAAHLHVKKLVHRMKKEEVSMCKAFDELMEEERQKGRREGRREGKQEGKQEGKREGEKIGKKQERISIIKRMYKRGMGEALIREMTGCTKKEFAAALGK